MAVSANTAEAACRSVLDRVFFGFAALAPPDGIAISSDPREPTADSPKGKSPRSLVVGPSQDG